jgi:hypothetical protein
VVRGSHRSTHVHRCVNVKGTLAGECDLVAGTRVGLEKVADETFVVTGAVQNSSVPKGAPNLERGLECLVRLGVVNGAIDTRREAHSPGYQLCIPP